jgi:class 3 adenylate cyclase
VTVLFAELTGFADNSERRDPEDIRALLAPYQTRLRFELERFGGTVERFIGDAVMALFGVPTAHEDDPERAVRAALAIRDWAAEDVEFKVQIGISTDEALITIGSPPRSGEAWVVGAVVNAAARPQGAAPLNAVLVCERTYRATPRFNRVLRSRGSCCQVEIGANSGLGGAAAAFALGHVCGCSHAVRRPRPRARAARLRTRSSSRGSFGAALHAGRSAGDR